MNKTLRCTLKGIDKDCYFYLANRNGKCIDELISVDKILKSNSKYLDCIVKDYYNANGYGVEYDYYIQLDTE